VRTPVAAKGNGSAALGAAKPIETNANAVLITRESFAVRAITHPRIFPSANDCRRNNVEGAEKFR
jgi:hypothetical protein